METDVTVLDDAEFERVLRSWGYDLDGLRADRKRQGLDPEVVSLGQEAAGVWWLLVRQSRWDEIHAAQAGRDEEEDQ